MKLWHWTPASPFFWLNLSRRFPVLARLGIGRRDRRRISDLIAAIEPDETPFARFGPIEVSDDWHVYDDND
jgi:hypothetical protein